MNRSICTVKGCVNCGRYCRIHIGYQVPVKEAINKVSDTKKELDKRYRKVRTEFLRQHPLCQAKIDQDCKKVATDVHHMRGKVGEEDYLNQKYFLAVCRHCHGIIERSPAWARQNGFSLSRLSKQ